MAGLTIKGDLNLKEGARVFNVPSNIIQKGDLSDTSHAYDCFTQQKFSRTLQYYLVNYVVSISGNYSVYK